MEKSPKKYELAYLLSPAIAEEDTLNWTGRIARIIEEAKGMVRHQENPRKIRLAYPVKKERSAYFGWITFTATPDLLSMLEKRMKTAENVIRHMVVEEEEIPVQPPRTFIPRPALPAKPRFPIPEAPKKEEERLDLEELDKKLEEILGK